MGSLEPGDPVDGGCEQNPVAQLGGPKAEPGSEMRLASPGWAEQDNIRSFGEECAGGQVRDGVAFEAGLMVEAEVLERFAGREPCGPGPGFGSGCFAGGDFPGEDRGEVFLMGPAAVSGLVGEPGRCFPNAGCLHGPGVVLNLSDGFLGLGHQATCPSSRTTLKARS